MHRHINHEDAEWQESRDSLFLVRTRSATETNAPDFLGGQPLEDQEATVERALTAAKIEDLQGLLLSNDQKEKVWEGRSIPVAIVEMARFHGLTRLYVVDRRHLCWTEVELPLADEYVKWLNDQGLDVIEAAPIREL
ncbi:hypothetical protein [Nocardioides sp. KR10-350]|uniref:hypothetical protein n=1 Tax=Nocardioides cheoyonin TaxID=3156615 RepID=UPI0032B5BE48